MYLLLDFQLWRMTRCYFTVFGLLTLFQLCNKQHWMNLVHRILHKLSPRVKCFFSFFSYFKLWLDFSHWCKAINFSTVGETNHSYVRVDYSSPFLDRFPFSSVNSLRTRSARKRQRAFNPELCLPNFVCVGNFTVWLILCGVTWDSFVKCSMYSK